MNPPRLQILAIALWLGGGVAPAIAQDRPNVLMILADDLRAELKGPGEQAIQTPSLDRLSSRTVSFARAYCQFPGCNPSRTSLLTGLRPSQTGIIDNRVFFRDVLPNVVTLPQLFRQNGYFTANIGKTFHGGASKGWDDPRAWDLSLFPETAPLGKKGKGRNLSDGALSWTRWTASRGGEEDQADGQAASLAIALLEEMEDRPFFLAVGFHKPHAPFVAPRSFFKLYRLKRFLGRQIAPQSGNPMLSLVLGKHAIFDRFDQRDRREFLRAYYAASSFMDAQLGRLLDALDRLGLWDNTVIVFVSDHGFHLGEQGWYGKNTLFETSARVPLMVSAPGLTSSGGTRQTLIELIDIFPTLTRIAGLPNPPNLAGRSFRRQLRSPRGPSKEAAFTEVRYQEVAARSVRTDRWRYTEWDRGALGRELYDHSQDPDERNNLAEDPERAALIVQLSALLRRIEP